jgi:hypothetical protein
VSRGVAIKTDRHWVGRGLWLGLLLTAAGYFALGEIPLPHVMWRTVIRSGLFPWGLLAFPTVVLLVAAAVAAVRRRDPTRWVSAAIGAAVAAVALVLIVVAGMGVIAWIVSFN